jgi:hypothetical protein
MKNTNVAKCNIKTALLLMAGFAFLLMLAGCSPTLVIEEPEGETGTHFNPASVYEDSILLGNEERPGGMDGFKISDVSVSHQGARLPEGVSTDMLHQGGWVWDLSDKDGTLPADYEYIFITYRLTNETNAEGWFMLNSAGLFVLGDEYEILGGGGEAYYLNGKDLAAAETAKDKQIARETLELGESGTYTVAFVLESDAVSKGFLCFAPDTSIGMNISDPLLPYQGIRIEN